MVDSSTRRGLLHAGSAAAVTILTGCSGILHSREKGEILIITEKENRDQEWAKGQTLRIVGKVDGTIAFDESYQLPVSNLDLTVEAKTYSILVYVGDELIERTEWKVTDCRSQLLLDFQNTRADGIHIGTSNC